MKLLTLLVLSLLSLSAFATNELHCESYSGLQLDWDERTGELLIYRPNGSRLAEFSDLKLDRPRTIGVTTVIDMFQGEENTDSLASIIKNAKLTVVFYQGQVFYCD